MDNFFKNATRQGITVADIATRLGVSTQAVYHWKLGKTTPRLKTLIKLARLCKIDVDSMINDLL